MDLQQIKNDFAKIAITPKLRDAVNAIMDQAIARGSLSKEESDKIAAIIDIEIEAMDIKADSKKKMAAALADFDAGINKSIDAAIAEIEALDKKQ